MAGTKAEKVVHVLRGTVVLPAHAEHDPVVGPLRARPTDPGWFIAGPLFEYVASPAVQETVPAPTRFAG